MLNSLDPGKRLLVYLVINVIVSALTTLVVLTIWSTFALSAPDFETTPVTTQAQRPAVRLRAKRDRVHALLGGGI